MRAAGTEGGHVCRWAAQAERIQGGSYTRVCAGEACAERTLNMPFMSVTLDVSSLRGWLNRLARCRVEERGGRGGSGQRLRHAGKETGGLVATVALRAGHGRSAPKTCRALQ